MGAAGEPDRWKLCVSYANDNAGFAVGRLFVEHHFNDNSKAKVSPQGQFQGQRNDYTKVREIVFGSREASVSLVRQDEEKF